MDEPDRSDFREFAIRLPQLVFGCLATGERIWPSPQWIVFTGQSAEESVVFGWLDAVHVDDRPGTTAGWTEAQSTGEYFVEHRILRASEGSYRWHQTRASALRAPILLPTGTVDWVGSSVDVDELYRLRLQLAEAEGQLRLLVEGLPQLIWRSCDAGNWTWASPQWLDFTGQTQEQSHGRGWLDAVHHDDRASAVAAWAAARPHGTLDSEFRVFRVADGSYLWHRTRSRPLRDRQGRISEWLGTTTDIQALKELQARQQALLDELQYQAHNLEDEIQERKQIEARLLRTSLHDDLTGLHNRAYLMDRLKAALGRSSDEADRRCTVLFLDLDRFKLVNDSLGHQSGDRLLVQVGKRLHDCVGPQHALARLGGDEFAVLIEDYVDHDVAAMLADRIIAAMRWPIRLGQHEIFTSCSIGIVRATAGHLSADEVMRDADVAMYHSKRHESGGYAVFSESMRDIAIEALELRTDLRNAIARDEFRLHYQPITNIITGATVGVEALIRWQHPKRGLMWPAAFIAVAEESGLIREIGQWVLREACNQLSAWLERHPDLDLYVDVNASAVELRDQTYVMDVRGALNAARLDPHRLQLEVTETIFLNQPGMVEEMLDGLRILGVRVALDDFGTGYSSLSYLDRYEIDTIKIDRSFIVDMLSRPKAATIVRAIVGLGTTMGLNVVAEGVEVEEQLLALRNAGCELGQGYLLGRPQSADDVTAMLTQGHHQRIS